MAVHVIDLLEVIEIDHGITDSPVTGVRTLAQPVGGIGHAASVEAAGERIDFGQFAGMGFGPPALRNFVGELAIATPAEDDQGDVQQQGIDQKLVRPVPFAGKCGDHAWKNGAAGTDEQDNRSGRDPQRDQVFLGGPELCFVLCFCHRQLSPKRAVHPQCIIPPRERRRLSKPYAGRL